MPSWTYDPAQVTLSIAVQSAAGLEVSSIAPQDFSEGSFIRLSRSRPMWSKRVGAIGAVTRNKSNDRSGSLVFMLEEGSDGNALLSEMQLADEQTNKAIAALLIKDKNGDNTFASGKNAWLVTMPDMTRAPEAGAVEWSMDIDVLLMRHGGYVQM